MLLLHQYEKINIISGQFSHFKTHKMFPPHKKSIQRPQERSNSPHTILSLLRGVDKLEREEPEQPTLSLPTFDAKNFWDSILKKKYPNAAKMPGETNFQAYHRLRFMKPKPQVPKAAHLDLIEEEENSNDGPSLLFKLGYPSGSPTTQRKPETKSQTDSKKTHDRTPRTNSLNMLENFEVSHRQTLQNNWVSQEAHQPPSCCTIV